MKRFGQLLTVALFASAVWTTSANAADNRFCAVHTAGMVATSASAFKLEDLGPAPGNLAGPAPIFGGIGSPAFFLAVSPIAREMLAVGLTTIALGSTVTCTVDLTVTPPRLLAIHLNK